jgi:uncharacterized repeat protein (TIGR01451 family)
MHQPNGPVRAADRPGALRRAVAITAFLLAASPLAAFAQSADLVINQADLPAVGPAGGVFTYTVRVDNNGPDGATGVTLSNTIPPGSTYVGVMPTQGSCSQAAGVVSCTLGNLAFLAQATVAIQVILPTPGVWTNSASTTSAVSDPNLTNNAGIEDTTAQNAANMSVTATDGPDPVAAGGAYSYTVTATNNGPTALVAADTQTIWFVVPAGSCITSAPTGSGWSCSVSPSASYPVCSNGTSFNVDCVRTGALAVGASAPPLTVPAVANVGGSITAAFHVESSLPDGDESDNTVEATTTVIGGYSDVSITKTRSPTTVTVGTNVTYTLTPRHLGGEPPGTLAPNLITVTDTLNAALTFVSVAGSGWTCDTTGLPTIVCSRPGPYAGGNFTDMPAITIVATVNAAGTIPNTATIAIPEQDPNLSNNSSSVNVTGTNSADLRMTKTASINPVIPGQAFSYALTVRNLGNAAVQAGQTITATDTLPAGVELTAAPSGTGWTCTPDGTATYPIAGPVTITCTRSGPLAVNSDAPGITVPARLPAAGSAVNNACVALTGSGPTDSNSGNDCRSVTVVASVTQADLQVVSKTVSPNPVNAGEDLTYTISVINNGPDSATNVVVTDTLASLIAVGGFRSATPSQGSCTPSGVTNGASVSLSCNLGSLANGGTATVTVVVRPSRATTGSRTNTATITSNDIGDPNRTNNSASVTSTITAVVDIQALKTATPSPVQAGAPLLFVVTARNNGPSTALNVVATDTMPSNAAFISLGTVTGGGSCTTPAVNTVGGQVVCTWPSLAATSPPTQQTASYYVRPLTSAAGTDVVNSVAMTTTVTELDLTNNGAGTSTPVTPALVDLLIDKVDSVDPVALGQSTTYIVAVTNGGPSYATNVVMTDTFPSGSPTATFSYQGSLTVSPPGAGTCVEPASNATSGTLTCTFPVLANQGRAIVTYVMRAESIAAGVSGTTFNDASVTASEPEVLFANNATTHATTSRRTADLALTKAGPANVTPGNTITWTITIQNNGPNASAGATLSDTLPAGVTFQSASSGCANAAGVVTCTLGTIASGSSAQVQIVALVSTPYTGATPLVNAASVTTVTEVDPVPGNNTGTSTTPINTPSANLSLVKTGPATGLAGARFQWKLVIANAGPSAADGATFLDTLPDGTTVAEATCGEPTGGAVCGAVAFDATTVTGTITTLPATGSVTIMVTASRALPGDAVNTATVSPPPGTEDSDPSDDTGTATIRIDKRPEPTAVPAMSNAALAALALLLAGAAALWRRRAPHR